MAANFSQGRDMGSEDGAGSQFTSSYANGPPWLFKGRALYQLHLVKAESARKLIPKELKLVEAFGYTLGGLFLARYDASPAGAFDELVVISGIVWNPPTSCAWAARVLVSSREACEHGRKEVGLPSHLAEFFKVSSESPRSMKGKESSRRGTALAIREIGDDGVATPLCSISLPLRGEGEEWMWPKINFSLPNFSGRTVHNPQLLKYSCRVKCRFVVAHLSYQIKEAPFILSLGLSSRVRPVEPARIASASISEEERETTGCLAGVSDVLRSRPLLALEFSSLEMLAGAPAVVPPRRRR